MSKFPPLILLIMLGLSGNISAQIYQSTDEAGNVVYSDTPSADTREIQVPESNVADPVVLPEPAPEPMETEPSKPVDEGKPIDEGVLIGGKKDDDNGHRRHRRHRRPRPTPHK